MDASRIRSNPYACKRHIERASISCFSSSSSCSRLSRSVSRELVCRDVSVDREHGEATGTFVINAIYSEKPENAAGPWRLCVNAAKAETRRRGSAKINGIHIERGAGSEYSCHRMRAEPTSGCAGEPDDAGPDVDSGHAYRERKTCLNAPVMRAKRVPCLLLTRREGNSRSTTWRAGRYDDAMSRACCAILCF